ncbi:MAG: IS256 family transposase, partial [bacterium]
VTKAACKLPWKEGLAKLKKQAEWLSVHHPDASASLLEGLEETFTINRLDLSPSLRRCLGTTNIIENPHSGVRMRTRGVRRWRNGKRVLRWAASAFLATEKNFRRIQGHRDLWRLKAALESYTSDDKDKAA